MTGAIFGDIAGSYYEWTRTKVKDDVLIFHPGADADTQAAIAGGIAEAFYGVVPDISAEKAKNYLPEEFRTLITTFYHTFINHRPWQ